MTQEEQSVHSAIVNISSSVATLASCIEDLKKNISEKTVTAQLVEMIGRFDSSLVSFENSILGDVDFESMSGFARNILTYTSSLIYAVKASPDNPELTAIVASIKVASSKLQESMEDRAVVYIPNASNSVSGLAGGRVLVGEVIELRQQNTLFRKVNQENHEALNAISARMVEITAAVVALEADVEKVLKSTDKLYDDAVVDLNEKLRDVELKNKEVESLLGVVSSKAIAGSYEKSAEKERFLAEVLRGGSIFFMVMVVVVAAFSFHDSFSDKFNWQGAGFRLVFALLLSIPSAYLARESTKHRLQQYAHLQMSLDLHAITPYLASLPLEEQHRLKADFANRLFLAKDQKIAAQDSYPLNSQELIMAFLNKLDIKSKK